MSHNHDSRRPPAASSTSARITGLIHHPYRAPAEFDSPQPPLARASTVFFPNVQAMREREWKDKSAYTYGLHGTPSSFMLEERLAALEGGTQCLLVPSGLSAIAHVALGLLRAGDEVLVPDNAYGPTKQLAEGELARFGIAHEVYDPMDVAALEALMTPRTRLVLLEAAGSVTLEFPPLRALVALCRARGIVTALDNTWGAGLAFDPFDLDGRGRGVDVSVHALTKYPSGGGDVLMGSIVTRHEGLHLQIKLAHMRLGTGVGMHDVDLLLRSLPSIGLRYAASDRTARQLAQWAQTQPAFAQVLHPALPGSPGHEHWAATCGPADARGDGAAAGLFSVVFPAGTPQRRVDAFCDALKLFRLGYSWGGPVSLVVPYDLPSMRVRQPDGIVAGPLVRFSTGLEDADDLRRDIGQALAALHATA